MSTPAGHPAARKISGPVTIVASRARHALRLTATHEDIDASEGPDGDRNLGGVLIPYGEVGMTSIGPITVPGPGRILPLDADLSRIKFVSEHQDPPVSIGYMTDLTDTDDALRGSHYVSNTEQGNIAWADYHEGARDAFSVELVDVWLTDSGELVEGTLKAVAFVTTPAWANARPDRLAASFTPLEGSNKMTPEQIARLAALRALTSRTPEEETEFAELAELALDDITTTLPEPDPEPEPEPEPEPQPAGAAHASRAPARPARMPSTPAPRRRTGVTLHDVYASMARVFRGESRTSLEAALSNITSTANIWTAQPEFGGQLWSGLQYQRRFTELMSPGELRSYKGTAWRWGVKPAVGDYAGDKAAVPSNAPTTIEVPWTAARLAGAHDLDRKFIDFGDTEYVEAYYEAMRESYARQSDAKAEAFLVASATAAGAAGVSLFRGAAFAAAAVEAAVGSGTVPDYFLINPTDRMNLIGITQQNIPAYLEVFGVTPDKFRVSSLVPALSVVGGVNPPTTFKELPGSPIRVEAIDMVNGGVDGGVFGYYATLLNFAGGIQRATFT